LAAQVGGLGMAPGANIGDECAIFEATHGSAPKYAGLDRVNPSSLILSGAMLLEFLGWIEAANLIHQALPRTLAAGVATYDLARLLPGTREISCSAFGQQLVEHMG
jgi:isocitrate dehydrogenase